MNGRARLPNRRLQITTRVTFGSPVAREWLVGVGFDRDGKAREIFDNGHKTGQALEFLLQDACVLASVCLQSGHDIEELVAMCARQGIEPDSAPSSEIGAILRKAAAMQAQEWTSIAEAYAASDARPDPRSLKSDP